jgi:hypothetical protein
LIIKCKRPVLIVEGNGDVAAVPRLIRETLHRRQIYDVSAAPRPKKNVELRRLRRIGELERFVEYALREDGDSVLVVLDCEDFDPAEIGAEFIERVGKLDGRKKIGVVLLKSEFETLFLYCLSEIAAHFPEYGWRTNQLAVDGDPEAIRNAKGRISVAMRERAYKPTRDQERFITPLDFDKLRRKSPSFRRFEETLLWLAGQRDADEQFYPIPRSR